jgi:hypothetical protein
VVHKFALAGLEQRIAALLASSARRSGWHAGSQVANRERLVVVLPQRVAQDAVLPITLILTWR